MSKNITTVGNDNVLVCVCVLNKAVRHDFVCAHLSRILLKGKKERKKGEERKSKEDELGEAIGDGRMERINKRLINQ